MPAEKQYKPHRTLRTVAKKKKGAISCRAQCTELHEPATEAWFTCMEECQQKAKEAQTATT